MPRLPALLASLLATLCLVAPARAWAPFGHQTVGGIADQLIAGTPTAKKVRAILGGNLQMASVWADCARSVEKRDGQWAYVKLKATDFPECKVYENDASKAALIAFVKRNASHCGFRAGKARCRHNAWHFTNLSVARTVYDANAPGAADNDLVQALAAAITVLQGGKPAAGFNIASQREALRLVAHFVGDVHQPLHVGAVYLDAKGQRLEPGSDAEANDHGNAGGNALLLKGGSLHRVWDNLPGKITTALLAGAGAAEAKQIKRSPGAPDAWPALWASDTLVQAASAYQGLRFGAKLGDDWPATATEPAYRLAREDLQRQQMVKAGARLAQLVTALFP